MSRLLPFLFSSLSLIATTLGQSAEQIIDRARFATTLQHNDLTGSIRQGNRRIPVALFLKGQNIQFQYAADGRNWTPFHMRLGDDKFDLFEFRNGKTIAFNRDKLAQPVAGTDLTFEDLSMRFFYWPNPILEGEERVKTFNCHKIRLNNPGNQGAYAAVYVWVHKEFGAFMKVEGFDRQGRKLKEFTVEDVMKLPDGSHTLKEMRVSSYQGGRRTGISYLEFDKPKGPGGLR